MNSSILTLETRLIILEIIQLVKHLLKKGLNKLNEIRKTEIIKYKRRTSGQKKLLNLFDDLLDVILTDQILESESQEDKNENENKKY